MNDILHFEDIINLWPTCADFGRDIGAKDVTARAMRRRNTIPGKYWNAVVDAARNRNFHNISLEVLSNIASGNTKPATTLNTKKRKGKNA